MWTIRLALTFIVAAVLLLSGGCNETQDKTFSTMTDAQKEQMIEKGWLPTFTPADATDIHFKGDLDSGVVYGSFSSTDTRKLRESCATTQNGSLSLLQFPSWFPREIKVAATLKELRAKGYEVFHCNAGNLNVAVLSSHAQVFYWSANR